MFFEGVFCYRGIDLNFFLILIKCCCDLKVKKWAKWANLDLKSLILILSGGCHDNQKVLWRKIFTPTLILVSGGLSFLIKRS